MPKLPPPTHQHPPFPSANGNQCARSDTAASAFARYAAGPNRRPSILTLRACCCCWPLAAENEEAFEGFGGEDGAAPDTPAPSAAAAPVTTAASDANTQILVNEETSFGTPEEVVVAPSLYNKACVKGRTERVMTTTEDTGVVASAVDNRMRRSSLYNRIQGKTHAGERKVYFKSCRGEVNMEEKNDDEPAACTGFNSFAFRIPIYNLFHPFVSTQNEQPGWPQISEMLMNISLGSALALALVRATLNPTHTHTHTTPSPDGMLRAPLLARAPL